MSYKKYCTLDSNDNFIEFFDEDQINQTTVYAVPPKVSSDTSATWRYPGWSIKKIATKKNIEQSTAAKLSDVKKTGRVPHNKSEKERLLDTYDEYVNYHYRNHFENRIKQYHEAVVHCFEKYEIPNEFIEYYPVMVEYLEKCNARKVKAEIIVEEIIENPGNLDKPQEPNLMLANTTNTVIEENIPSEITPSFEINYDEKKMFPKMIDLDINTPLAINFFHDYILKQNGIEAHPYNDVKEIDS